MDGIERIDLKHTESGDRNLPYCNLRRNTSIMKT